MKKNGNKLILTASILSYVFAGISIMLGVFLGFNVFNLYNIVVEAFADMGYELSTIDTEIFIYTLEFIIGGVVEIYFANFYRRVYESIFLPKEAGKTIIIMGVLQILFASFVPAIFAIIAGVRVKNGKVAKIVDVNEERVEIGKRAGISEFKMTAMSEAVSRLNELRKTGAISEEEYYATLNKILEG